VKVSKKAYDIWGDENDETGDANYYDFCVKESQKAETES
jgi:hypothetical protein